MTMSAPCSTGRTRYGVARVLSTIRGTPARCAVSATPVMSRTSFFGFGIVSAKNAFVFGRTSRAHSSRSRWSATKSTSMPRRPRFCTSSPLVPS
ncbi:hypothetical protein QP157_12410 [Sphingomonas sp. LR61]